MEHATAEKSHEIWHSMDDMRMRGVRIGPGEALSISVAGQVIVMTVAEWHALGKSQALAACEKLSRGDAEDRWTCMKRQNNELREMLKEMIDIADAWCVSASCVEPMERAQLLLSTPPPK